MITAKDNKAFIKKASKLPLLQERSSIFSPTLASRLAQSKSGDSPQR